MQDWHPAVEAHRSVLEQCRQPWAQDNYGAWTQTRLEQYGMDAAIPSAIAFRHEIEDLLASDVFTISPEMMDLTHHAFSGFDRTEPADPDDFFVDAGFIYLPTPFISLDIHGKRVAWRAMNYRLVPDIPVDRDGETVHEWGLRLLMYLHTDDREYDDYPIPDHILDRAKATGMNWGYTHATTLPLSLVHSLEDVSGEGDQDATWLTFFRVLHRLMGEHIVVRSPMRVPRPQRRDYRRSTGRETPLCTVIELRRPTEHTPSEGDGKKINYSHRFIVRGHWRKGHERTVHTHEGPQKRWIKQTFVGAYEKGEGDLIIKQRVWVWDR